MDGELLSIDGVLEGLNYKKIETDEGESLELHRVSTAKGCVEFVKLYEDTFYKPHIHDESDAQLHILRGDGTILLNGDKKQYTAGSAFNVPRGISHGFKTVEETYLLSIQSNPILNDFGEMDVRYEG